jgi:hypothetical protein
MDERKSAREDLITGVNPADTIASVAKKSRAATMIMGSLGKTGIYLSELYPMPTARF